MYSTHKHVYILVHKVIRMCLLCQWPFSPSLWMSSAWHWPQQCWNMYISSWPIWQGLLFVKFFNIKSHNYVNSKPLVKQHFKNMRNWLQWYFFCTTIPSFWIFFWGEGGGSTSFSSNWKKNHFITNLAIFDETLAKNYKK